MTTGSWDRGRGQKEPGPNLREAVSQRPLPLDAPKGWKPHPHPMPRALLPALLPGLLPLPHPSHLLRKIQLLVLTPHPSMSSFHPALTSPPVTTGTGSAPTDGPTTASSSRGILPCGQNSAMRPLGGGRSQMKAPAPAAEATEPVPRAGCTGFPSPAAIPRPTSHHSVPPPTGA